MDNLNGRENIEWMNIWREKAYSNKYSRIALVGDSVTRGIRSGLQELYMGGGITVDLIASSAQLSDSCLIKQIKFFFDDLDYKYQKVVINVGGQHGIGISSVRQGTYGLLFSERLDEIHSIVSRYCSNIYFCSYTPCAKKDNLEKLDEERNSEIKARNAFMKKTADGIGCKYIDIYSELEFSQEYKHVDYIHFDKESNMKIAALIKEGIEDI